MSALCTLSSVNGYGELNYAAMLRDGNRIVLAASGVGKPPGAANDGERSSLRKHHVFAHYMVCFAAHGERVEDYKREIQEAQAAGIDGFALNCGAWHDEPHYPRRAKAIYQAAQDLGTGFKLFFSVDFAGLKKHPPGEFESYVLDMVKTYGHHPNQFMVDGRAVVSTFGGEEGIAWKQDILAPAQGGGIRCLPHSVLLSSPASDRTS